MPGISIGCAAVRSGSAPAASRMEPSDSFPARAEMVLDRAAIIPSGPSLAETGSSSPQMSWAVGNR